MPFAVVALRGSHVGDDRLRLQNMVVKLYCLFDSILYYILAVRRFIGFRGFVSILVTYVVLRYDLS